MVQVHVIAGSSGDSIRVYTYEAAVGWAIYGNVVDVMPPRGPRLATFPFDKVRLIEREGDEDVGNDDE